MLCTRKGELCPQKSLNARLSHLWVEMVLVIWSETADMCHLIYFLLSMSVVQSQPVHLLVFPPFWPIVLSRSRKVSIDFQCIGAPAGRLAEVLLAGDTENSRAYMSHVCWFEQQMLGQFSLVFLCVAWNPFAVHYKLVTLQVDALYCIT